MLNEATQRVRQGLAELIRLVNDADTSTAAARRVLEDSKAFGAQVAVLQADDGEELYRRQRARRRLSFWDGDDGMVHLRGELDPVTGAKVRKRFSQEAERLRRQDLHSAGGDKRTYDQRMADALDTLTSHSSIYPKADKATPARSGHGGSLGAIGNSNVNQTGGDESGFGGAEGAGRCGCRGRPSADITIVQHLDADGTDAFAEVAGGGVIPQSVLEEHFCNARIKGVVFSSEGLPLWHGHTKRVATKAQMNALRARYGACGGCNADMWICDGHHVEPVSQGGPTNIDNMMLLCWWCHQKVHHHGWREVPDGRGLYTIAPPERIRHGPAHAPDPPPAPGPPTEHGRPGHRPPPEHGPPPGRSPGRAGHGRTAQAEPRGPGSTAPDQPSLLRTEPLFTIV